MENKETKKVDSCCACCPKDCTCGDCACCKEGMSSDKCSTDTSCCGSSCAPRGCPCCSRMRSCCRLCKVARILFGLLVIAALWHIAFGGGMRHMGGMGMGGGCGCGMNSGAALSGQMNCMGMKGMDKERGERKGWFNRGGKDSDDKKKMRTIDARNEWGKTNTDAKAATGTVISGDSK